jgi:micrococcal nuclease
MSPLPKISSFKSPAKTFAQIILLIIIVAIIYAIINTFNNYFVNNKIDNRKLFIQNLAFDYRVTRVIDGDTLEIERLDGKNIFDFGKEVKVRLIGINSPESVDPRRPVECFGEEAKEFVDDIADSKIAALELDNSQSRVDKYGRLLAYVFVKKSGIKDENVIFLNEEAIKEGYAYEYTYEYPYKYQQNFKSLQAIARANKLGLWSINTCNGLKIPVAAPKD